MAVLAVLDDLVFRTKIETAATHAGITLSVSTSGESLTQLAAQAPWELVIVDLNLVTDDPIQIVTTIRRRAPTVPLIGYCSHGQTDLQARAIQAGCTIVLPRSAFVQHLPELLMGKLPLPAP